MQPESHLSMKLDLWRIFRISAVISLSMIYVIQWMGMILNHSQKTGTDFIAFYTAGRITKESGASTAYNIPAQHALEQELVGFSLEEEQVLLYNHMPYLLPILGLIMTENYNFSFLVWIVLMIGLYGLGTVFFINTLLSVEIKSLRSIFAAGMLTFFPFFFSLLLGQDTALLFLGVALWYAGFQKKNNWVTAIGLALTTVRPHMCLLLTIPLFFRHRKIWWRFLLLASGLALTSILLIGQQGTLDFLNIIRISADGTWHGMNEASMPNLIGLLWRIFPHTAPPLFRAVNWLGYLTGLITLIILWAKQKESGEILIGLSILIVLLCAPHLHYHDLTLLILPVGLLIKQATSQTTMHQLAHLPLGISLLMIFEPLRLLLPYLLYAALFWQFTKELNGNQIHEPIQ